MATLNQCSFIGYIGKDDPVLEVTNNGKPYTKFSLAVDQGKEQPIWLTVTCWDKLAETVEKYAGKGMLVFVQGKLQLKKYKDKQQVDRVSVEINASLVQLLEKRKKDEADVPGEVLPEA